MSKQFSTEITEEGRVCVRCVDFKPWSDYSRWSRSSTGYRAQCKLCDNKLSSLYREEIKRKVFEHYGGKCACQPCGETNPVFLTIDHIDNNGAEHRRLLGRGKFYLWLIQNNYPNDCQILCFNCNCGKQRNGGMFCPHTQVVQPTT